VDSVHKAPTAELIVLLHRQVAFGTVKKQALRCVAAC